MQKTINSESYKSILKRLRLARLEAGFTQTKVARLIGRPQSYVSKIESGERRVDVIEIKVLSDIYNKPVSFFIH